MKILVYNYKEQYALSRKQVEAIKAVLPNEYFRPIREFHLTHTPRGVEVFEYQEEEKAVHFAFPVKEKTPETTVTAIEELLIGLARIKAATRWEFPLRVQERKTYMGFVELWKAKCIESATKKP